MYYAITRFPEDFSSPGPATICFDDNGNRLARPDVRYVPGIIGVDGVDTSFFGGSGADGDGFPNFFGTTAAAPDVAGVAALVLQAAGGSGKLTPAAVYRRLQETATPVWLSSDRSISGTVAGPVVTTAQEDWTRIFYRYFSVGVLPTKPKVSVASIAFDVSKIGLKFSSNPNRFNVGLVNGIAASDITFAVSSNSLVFTLNFAAGKLVAGGSFTFGMSVFSPLQDNTQEDADRFEGMGVTVTMSDGSTHKSNYLVAPRFRNFTGAGLVNADLATRF